MGTYSRLFTFTLDLYPSGGHEPEKKFAGVNLIEVQSKGLTLRGLAPWSQYLLHWLIWSLALIKWSPLLACSKLISHKIWRCTKAEVELFIESFCKIDCYSIINFNLIASNANTPLVHFTIFFLWRRGNWSLFWGCALINNFILLRVQMVPYWRQGAYNCILEWWVKLKWSQWNQPFCLIFPNNNAYLKPFIQLVL